MILKGMEVSEKIKSRMKEQLTERATAPMLAIVRIGEKPDDISYERGAKKKIEAFGMNVQTFSFPEHISHEAFEQAFQTINQDSQIDGILLLRPLPRQIREKEIEALIAPEKDLDGISPVNAAKVFSGDHSAYAPCTAEAVIELLKHYEVALSGKQVCIIGRSMVVGKPLAMLLLKEDATVTICHSKTENIKQVCARADVVIAAVGRARMITGDYLKPGAVVIDVGINVDQQGVLCGDVDFASASARASMITPVPGGVGTVTTAVLGKHLLASWQLKH